jgi:hypothetical protein
MNGRDRTSRVLALTFLECQQPPRLSTPLSKKIVPVPGEISGHANEFVRRSVSSAYPDVANGRLLKKKMRRHS